MSATALATDSLAGGTCMLLPMAVVEKYFFANGRTQPFEFQTAKAICRQCPVRGACLASAITRHSRAVGVRGGESDMAIRSMRRKYLLDGVPVVELVAAALALQRSDRDVGDFAYLRRGEFRGADLVGRSA